MKKYATLALIALLGAAAAQEPEPRLTYRTVAVPVKRAVQEIAAQTGARIDVAAAAATDIVVIRVEDAPLGEVLDRIAKVTSGEWRTDADGTRWLNRSQTTVRAEQAESLRRRIASFASEIEEGLTRAESIEEEEGAPPPPVGFMGSEGASARGMLQLASLIGAANIAAVGRGDRVVYATNPTTRMQVQLGGAASRIVTEMIVEHNRAAAARKAATPNDPDIPKTVEQERMEEIGRTFMDMFGFAPPRDEITTPPAKALLAISRGGGLFGMFGDSIELSLKVFDQNGRVILAGTHTLGEFFGGMMPSMESDDEEVDEEQTPPPPVEPGPVIEFSRITREMMEYFDFGTMAASSSGEVEVTSPSDAGITGRAPSAELMERLNRPDNYDPLSFSHSEALLAIADHHKLQLVANLPDTIVSFMDMMNSRTPVTVGLYLKGLEDDEDLSLGIEDGLMTLMASDPAEARLLRADRSALTRLIASVKDKEMPSLDDLAAYALRAEPPMQTPIVLPYMMMFAPGAVGQGFGALTNWNMLRFFGTLSPTQRQVLDAGGSVPFRTLTPQQNALVRRMAYGAEAKLEVVRPDAKPQPDLGGFFEMMMEFMPKRPTDYRDEPTEVMPNGLPNDGFVSLNGTAGMFAVAIRADGSQNRMFGSLGAAELAMLKFFSENPMFAGASEFMPRMDRLRVGNRRTLKFSFHLADGVSVRHTLQDDHLQRGSPIISMDNLPAEFRAQIDKEVERMRNTPFPWGIGGMG